MNQHIVPKFSSRNKLFVLRKSLPKRCHVENLAIVSGTLRYNSITIQFTLGGLINNNVQNFLFTILKFSHLFLKSDLVQKISHITGLYENCVYIMFRLT